MSFLGWIGNGQILLVMVLMLGGLLADGATVDQTAFPDVPNKKGLQVQMVDDAVALGIHHAGINVSLGALFQLVPAAQTIRFQWEGKEWLINGNYVRSLDAQIKPLSDAKVTAYLILLAYPTKDPAKDKLLLHPAARADGKYSIAGFNTATPEGLALYRALVAFLAERYSGAHPEHGRVWGYIIGNEVNSQWLWYNMGLMTVDQAAAEYEKAVRAASEVIRMHSAHARCYLSFDHHWNTSMPGISENEAYKTRDFLGHFALIAKERGDFEWHVAHHPYPDNLGNPRTWLDKDAWPTEDTPHITFKNLEVACKVMEKPEWLWEGKPRRIILSEQGLHCLKSPEGERLQAAGFAYVWEKVCRQDGIDALIWHRQVDHAKEGGLRLGLWENKPGTIVTPGKKRPIWELFRKAGTPEWDAAAVFALPIVGLKSWDELTK
ncbi:MAG: hypothetical protein KDK97_06760 [Verrucomicrobiales bacterium]|nr:hypothetical protein [Verrucomicrobiales bacterium]MCP5558121.1 hypothetical protein [Verrucomicrobiaceae bacterium]